MKISITEARRRVPEVIGAAIAGQDVIITRRGKTDHVFRAGEEIITVRRVDPAQTPAAMRAIRRALKNRRYRPALETAIEGLHAERQRRGR
ncbi:MAG: type II toxin-antitoxin system prevent-host-death family antitoxin [Betaproteobacteria bacterium]|nr:type II toxin-antitoxin system prevent-host-death family antitoxin [Betaproteobacteria bacterium]